MTINSRMALLLLGALGLAVLGVGCSSGPALTTVDDASISFNDVAALHVDVELLDEDERAGSLLLLILREAFGAAAVNDLNVPLDEGAVDEAFEERVDGFAGRGGADVVLGSLNQTLTRLRIESELDVLRDSVAVELVETEAPGFDLDAAYTGYLLAEAEVCIRLMQLEQGTDFDVALDRLAAGEEFSDVARDISIDPFVGREDGVGAGGDLGCSAPSALPGGLDTETLSAPLNEPAGPVLADTGMYLVEVYERTAPALIDVRAEVLDFGVEQQGPEMFRRWAVTVLQEIEVEVADEFGTWAMLPETDPVRTVVPPYRESSIIDS